MVHRTSGIKIKRRILTFKNASWALFTIIFAFAVYAVWYVWPYSDNRERSAIVKIYAQQYYTITVHDSAVLFFSNFDTLGINRIATEPIQAVDTVVAGGFILNRAGDILTSQRVTAQSLTKIDHLKFNDILQKELSNITKKVNVLKRQYKHKDVYLDTHIEEDNGYAEMSDFYKKLKPYIMRYELIQKRLEQLVKDKDYKVSRINKIHVLFSDSTQSIGTQNEEAYAVAQRDGIALIHLKSGKLPEGHKYLALAWWDEGSGKSKRDVFRLRGIGFYGSPNSLNKEKHSQINFFEGIQMTSKDKYIYTEMAFGNDMDGFPLINRWGRVVAVSVKRDANSIGNIKGVKSKVIRQWLNSLGHADEKP